MKMITGWIVCTLALAVTALAGGDKGEPARVSFHVETEGGDNPKMVFPYEVMGNQRMFRRIPDVSSKDFVAFTPFPADDQASYGVIFQLKASAGRRLAAVTSVNQGKWLVSHAFGRIVDAVLIDAPVNDGKVVIWKNITVDEIREMDKSLPRIGEKRKK